jgi:crotonobetainyl-CoA:carnitine CoA-transferase CaiB-like acyl-CoA transferase
MTPVQNLPASNGPRGLNFLEGVKVLDLTTSIAGPYATQLLADLGATVVKIERPPLGDDCRAWGPPFLDGESLWFIAVNRNKQSLVLDYSTEAGVEILRRLVQVADVVVVNQVRSAQCKLGIDYDALSKLRQGVIHASITGFGLTGSRSEMPCYDLIAEGYSGVMDLTGEPDGEPQKVGTPAADMLAGQDAALAVLAALVRRNATGEGCEIDVSLVESMTRFMAPRLVPYLGSGVMSRRSGGRDSVIAIYQMFETADEPLTLGLGNDRIWGRFWSSVGDEEFGRHARFATNALRRENRGEIVSRIATILKTKSRSEWLQRFAESRIPAGPINRLDDIANDEGLLDRQLFYRVRSRNGDDIPQVGLGIKFDGRSEACVRAPPRLGEHSNAVLEQWLDEEVRAEVTGSSDATVSDRRHA